jgi:hypothetical protein
MSNMSGTMRAFAEASLMDVLKARRDQMLQEVQAEPSHQLLNVNESDYVRYLAGKYRIEPLTLDFGAIQVSQTERMVPIGQHPLAFRGYLPSQNPAYLRQVVIFHIPFTGDSTLFRYQPSSTLLCAPVEINVSRNEITFSLVNWNDNVQELKNDQSNLVERIRQQSEYLTTDVQGFNSGLEAYARQMVSQRKAKLLSQLSLVESLGIPLRKSPSTPQTFAVPVAPKKLFVKPRSSGAAYSPDPTLDQTTYQDILSIIHDGGIAMERLPSTYASKGEEDLRDYLLTILCTHYPNTTGETFNKQGKTDILVRHEGANVFVGECKFWKGISGFHDTIDQILGYLTWRDSKAAIICFVTNKELKPVLDQIGKGTPDHPYCIRLEGKKNESWFQFEFRLKSDPTRNARLAVLCFHFPPG